ncbi:MAG: glycosyltransferase [Oscillospiraceae bacterium]|nr:glycosyltransferase [Oscillospiraceae bacterium]
MDEIIKKKIAIVFSYLIVGGTEESLINFINSIDRNRYEITLFTRRIPENYLKRLEGKVKICYITGTDIIDYDGNIIKDNTIKKVIINIIFKIKLHITKNNYKKNLFAYKTLPKYREAFDCAIAYKANYIEPPILLSILNTKKKITWVHSELSSNIVTIKEYSNCLNSFDKIFCVSQRLKQILIKYYPQTCKKSEVFYNILDIKKITDKSSERIDENDLFIDNTINIVTVGRISGEKGYDRIPDVMKQLVDNNYKIKWIIIGDGPDRERIENLIKEHNVENNVVLLGTRENPYPYMRACDIYVQPSYTEGYCTTTYEAKILHKPVVTTDVPGMREQFESGKNGLIAESSVDGLYDGIKKLIDEPELREKFIHNLENESMDNSGEIEKLYKFIEE